MQGLVLLHRSASLLGPVSQPRVLTHLCAIIKLILQLDSTIIWSNKKKLCKLCNLANLT